MRSAHRVARDHVRDDDDDARGDDARRCVHAVDARCLLYTSDAADDLLCVDLGGRRIIKKKKKKNN